jgi:hypothetical protein
MLEIASSPNCFLIKKHYSRLIARLRGADLAGDLVQKKDRPCERSKSWGGNALEGQVTRSKDLDSGRYGAIDLCK